MPAPSPIDLLLPLLYDPPDLSSLRDGHVWKTIRETSAGYGVAPLIAFAARLHVPPAERAWCDRVLVESWTRHERMLRNLEHILGLFEAEGIPVISLKGPLLANRYYAPAFLRKPSMDLDLAVVERDLERTCDVLTREGYTVNMPVSAAIAQHHHVEFIHPDRPPVEVHFRLSHRALGIPVDEFFARAVSVPLPNGRDALVLGPADQLLHLVLHLAYSRFGTLFHLCEIRRISEAEPVAVRLEAINRAIGHHYVAAFRMMDIAMRERWNKPFLPNEPRLPRTWLDRRLTPSLYRAFENYSTPGRALNLPTRIYARWLDLQLTDTPADALRVAAFFFRTAGFYFGERSAWGTPRRIHFVPNSRR